ncbi:hypothetical protein ABEF95_006121 [Exophiala dermatitidis]
MSPTTATATRNQRFSRSNSTSSSVKTVQQAASTSAKSAPGNGYVRRMSKVPGDTLSTSEHQRYDRSRSRSRPENSLQSRLQGSSLNINRWSHSTSSSVSAIETDAVRVRANVSSRRLSLAPPMSSAESERGGLPSSTNPRPASRSPAGRPNQAPGLLQVESNYGSREVSPIGVSPLTPTSMFNPSAGDMLGETWQGRKVGKNGESVAMSIHYMGTNSQPTEQALEGSSQDTTQTHHPNTNERPPPDEEGYDITDPITAPSISNRGRSHRSPTQKTMLSKALGKANTAVLLDNAQNIAGAIEAYAEACDLLQQVLVRSSDLDDRKKLSAIRSTYSNRIAELHDLDDSFSVLMEKALPEDPPFDDANHVFFTSDGTEPDTAGVLETVHIPPRQESLLPEIFGGDSYLSDPSSRRRLQIPSLAVPMEAQYMPRPLSPRRAASPSSERDTMRADDPNVGTLHAREHSTESTSWLDTLEDGETSSRSSRLSSVDFGIPDTHNLVDEIGAEFDAVLNAAVDAAYDDSLTEEPTPKPDRNGQDFSEDASGAIPISHFDGEQSLLQSDNELTREYDDGDSSEEEERLLEAMTKGYLSDDFAVDTKYRSGIPRQSGSSTFSGQTRSSSIPSTTATNATILSTLAESHEPSLEESPRPTPPAKDPVFASPPRGPLPSPPTSSLSPQSITSGTGVEKYAGMGLRERRLSGHSGKQLRVETFVRRNSSSFPIKPTGSASNAAGLPAPADNCVPRTAPLDRPAPSLVGDPQPVAHLGSMASTESMQSESPVTPALTQGGSQGSIDDSVVMPPSPGKAQKLMIPPQPEVRKNLSSSSLRVRNLSVATTEVNGVSPATPSSAGFSSELKKVGVPLPSAAFGPHIQQSGGMYLFDDHTGALENSESPQTPSAPTLALPLPLEPCPESFLLRPFWLMRCLYQTLAHPRGGYVTSRLFIPRDTWRVRNVKLKAIDDKVAQCDLLTAALLKLAKVDTFDADAMLEELQFFEIVLDQVRANLQKKLGNDVGFSGSSSIFKSTPEEQDQGSGKTNNTAAKSLASSWRKLRSRSSAPAVGTHGGAPRDGSAAGLTMPSLPMTSSSSVHSSRSHLNRRPPRPPTPTQLTNVPPIHATYMSSLARLFDAAQVLDGIARQVEDPGLKCSSKTQVGLELGVKNAAEFFAFYVLRFVMADLALLVDKFLKRGAEWVST